MSSSRGRAARLCDFDCHAFIWKITAVESHSALAAKQWIQRIVVGTIGVEVAGSLVDIITQSVPPAAH